MDCQNDQSSIPKKNQKGEGVQGGVEISLWGKSAYVPWVLPKYHNIDYMLDNTHNRVSVAENSSPSEENRTILTSSARDTREIAYGFCPENKVRGTQSQSLYTPWVISKDNNIEYILDNNNNRVSVSETSYPSEENRTTLTPNARDTK